VFGAAGAEQFSSDGVHLRRGELIQFRQRDGQRVKANSGKIRGVCRLVIPWK
jgi:hypothetical protein